jgi:hypothetical protein
VEYAEGKRRAARRRREKDEKSAKVDRFKMTPFNPPSANILPALVRFSSLGGLRDQHAHSRSRKA